MKVWYRYMILAAAVVMITAGIIRQEHLTVYKKAINICLECIGVG